MICAAWKWLNKPRVYSASVLDNPEYFAADPTDDYEVIAKLHEVLSEADAIIAHNGDKFDLKKFNARALYHGFDPISPLVQIDTLKIAKAHFKFTWNALDYLAKYLGVGKKIKTDVDLWLDCLAGKRSAIKKMVKYNKYDVVILEAVYNILAPYAPSKLNLNLFTDKRVCPHCGTDDMQKRGFRYTRTNKWQRLQCNECYSWSSYPISKTGKEGLIR